MFARGSSSKLSLKIKGGYDFTIANIDIIRQKQDERNTFKFMIESLLRKVKNITSVNPNLTSLKSHDIEIDWRKSLHNKTDSIMHCITSVHVHGINSNLSIEVPNNSENGQSIQVHRENCFQSHEFMLNYKYKNETYFRETVKVTTNMIEKLRCDFTKMSEEGQSLFALLISIVIVIAFTSTFFFVLYCFWYRQ